ncbi:hypothetical protein HPP92_005721 [Vanilla planifolia]|uniref:Putative plant transposon protein domain-containing protein n=1 Tax=Vanilla planifolia TaxID=51239 RepID=A0A835VCG1_VANPL|nr:hypothetical protein HPP92_005721 [Vanilla planifolia]
MMAKRPKTKRQPLKKSQSSASFVLDEEHFRTKDDMEAFDRIKECGVNIPKPINAELEFKSGVPVLSCFDKTGLEEVLQLSHPFNSTMTRRFYANLEISKDYSVARSYLHRIPVEIKKEDLNGFFKIPSDGPTLWPNCESPVFDWTEVNRVICNLSRGRHVQKVKLLTPKAYLVQHLLRSTIMPKRGDRQHITPWLSLATYYCLKKESFDLAETIFRLMKKILVVKNPNYKKKINLSYGHLIAALISLKYSVSSDELDCIPRAMKTSDMKRMQYFVDAHSTREVEDQMAIEVYQGRQPSIDVAPHHETYQSSASGTSHDNASQESLLSRINS